MLWRTARGRPSEQAGDGRARPRRRRGDFRESFLIDAASQSGVVVAMNLADFFTKTDIALFSSGVLQSLGTSSNGILVASFSEHCPVFCTFVEKEKPSPLSASAKSSACRRRTQEKGLSGMVPKVAPL